MVRVIHWELCKKFRFDHANKWYMHKPESLVVNETTNILWDFEMQMDHPISARRPDLVIIIKKRIPTQWTLPFRLPVGKTERKRKERIEKIWSLKMSVIPIVILALGTVNKGVVPALEDLEIREPVETIETTSLLRSARILRRVLETWWDLWKIP